MGIGQQFASTPPARAEGFTNSVPDTTFPTRLCLKLDLWLLTPMLFLAFLALMGRMNIGSALIQGLPTDLKLDSTKTLSVKHPPVTFFSLV